jgi:hypothetical protein
VAVIAALEIGAGGLAHFHGGCRGHHPGIGPAPDAIGAEEFASHREDLVPCARRHQGPIAHGPYTIILTMA